MHHKKEGTDHHIHDNKEKHWNHEDYNHESYKNKDVIQYMYIKPG